MSQPGLTISNKALAFKGAIVAVGSVFTYSLIVMIYVILRTSASIISIMTVEEQSSILFANGISVAYSVAVFSLLTALGSAVAGAVTAVILKKSLLHFNPRFMLSKAILISCLTSSGLLILLYAILYALLCYRISYHYTETFLFWFLIPAVIFFLVSIIGGSKLNNILKKSFC